MLAEVEADADLVARGVEVATQAGWYFTGREQALRDLTGWLADPGPTRACGW